MDDDDLGIFSRFRENTYHLNTFTLISTRGISCPTLPSKERGIELTFAYALEILRQSKDVK